MAKEEPKLCGHINKHFYNAKGKLEDLPCDLPARHKGDHHAVYTRLVPNPLLNEKGQVVEARYDEEQAEAFWGNAAGTLAKDIKAKEIPQLTEFQKDLVASVLKEHPEMPVEQAVEQAKSSLIWTAVNA